MKDKILELMRSPNPDSYTLGFELCAVHYPELLILIDYVAANGGILDNEHVNYNQYARQAFVEDICIGDRVPCDYWDIDIVKARQSYQYTILDKNLNVITTGLKYVDYETDIKASLVVAGWQ